MDDHGHDHSSEEISDDLPWNYFQYVEAALTELLIEKCVITAKEVQKQIEQMDSRTPAQGGRVVAKAWTDPEFKKRLLSDDASNVVRELGIEIEPVQLIVVENTEKIHNVVVCTLCSCYPRNLLGLPPDWYKSRQYRSRVVREPRVVLEEFGTEIKSDTTVRVHDSTADMRYMVLPKRPPNTENMSEEQLASLVKRDSMIGVTVID